MQLQMRQSDLERQATTFWMINRMHYLDKEKHITICKTNLLLILRKMECPNHTQLFRLDLQIRECQKLETGVLLSKVQIQCKLRLSFQVHHLLNQCPNKTERLRDHHLICKTKDLTQSKRQLSFHHHLLLNHALNKIKRQNDLRWTCKIKVQTLSKRLSCCQHLLLPNQCHNKTERLRDHPSTSASSGCPWLTRSSTPPLMSRMTTLKTWTTKVPTQSKRLLSFHLHLPLNQRHSRIKRPKDLLWTCQRQMSSKAQIQFRHLSCFRLHHNPSLLLSKTKRPSVLHWTLSRVGSLLETWPSSQKCCQLWNPLNRQKRRPDKRWRSETFSYNI